MTGLVGFICRICLSLAVLSLLFPVLIGGSVGQYGFGDFAGLFLLIGTACGLGIMARYQFHGPTTPTRPHLRPGQKLPSPSPWRFYAPILILALVLTILLGLSPNESIQWLAGPSLLMAALAASMPFLEQSNPSRDRSILASQMACILRMGIPLMEGLERLGQDARARRSARFAGLPTVLTYLAQDLRAGAQLSYALSCQSYFPEYWPSLVGLGERIENVPAELDRLAQLEAQRHASLNLARPLSTLAILGLTGLFISSYISPTFSTLSEAMGFSSQIFLPLKLAGQLCALMLLGVLGGLPLLAFGPAWLTRRSRQLSRHLPFVGRSVRLEQQGLACLAMLAGARSGRSLVDILGLARETVNLAVYRQLLDPQRALGGTSLGGCLARPAGLFEPEVVWLVTQGETLGDVSGGLQMAVEFLAERRKDAEQANRLALQVGFTLLAGALVSLYTFGIWGPAVGYYDILFRETGI